jgi:hypothetical protein
VILDDARLDPSPPVLGSQLQDFVQVHRRVEDHTARADGLAPERGPCTARDDRDIVLGGDPDCGLDVLDVPREDGARGPGLVDAPVCRVQHLAVLVEAHLALDGRPEVLGKVEVRLDVLVAAGLAEPLEVAQVAVRFPERRRLVDVLDRRRLHHLLGVVRVARNFDSHCRTWGTKPVKIRVSVATRGVSPPLHRSTGPRPGTGNPGLVCAFSTVESV